jgi:NO-binding membrane sensor protein with MHYT domain/DNA-binding CsgD family transcriptional regulator
MGAVLSGPYDYRLLALSVLLAVSASYVSFGLAACVTATTGWSRRAWLVGGAISMGVGIWSMHFVGMAAFALPIPVRYDVPTVLLSFLAAVFGSTAALFAVSRKRFGRGEAIIGSLVMGTGIAAAHYLGMDAMRLYAICRYNPLLVGLSIVIAVIASLAALTFASNFHHEPKGTVFAMLTSAALMGVTIASMHYVAMTAVTFRSSNFIGTTLYAVSVSRLGIAGVVCVAMTIMAFALLRTTMAERHSTQRERLPGPLTSREVEIVRLLAEGKANKEVAGMLGITVRTVETHRAKIMLKLGVHSIAELIHYAIRNKIVSTHDL